MLYALRHLKWRTDTFELPSYQGRCMLIDLDTLSSRRAQSTVMFMYDLLNGNIDAPDLLWMIKFHVPCRSLRTTNMLYCPVSRTNYGISSPISTLSSSLNTVGGTFDFNITRFQFKRAIRIGFPRS